MKLFVDSPGSAVPFTIGPDPCQRKNDRLMLLRGGGEGSLAAVKFLDGGHHAGELIVGQLGIDWKRQHVFRRLL